MKTQSHFAIGMAMSLIVASITSTGQRDAVAQERLDGPDQGAQIEPNAGNWRTWVISSGRDYRVPPPPNPAETQAELRALADLISHNDAQAQQQITFWDAGAPAYRWIDLLNARTLAGVPTATNGRTGGYTYVALAMYDATIATWQSTYCYNRQRQSQRHHKVP